MVDDGDNGSEFRGRALAAWSEERGVRQEFIQPGKPAQNACVESFNGRLRDECLNAKWFTSLSDARRKIESWRQTYSQLRLHSSVTCHPSSLTGVTWLITACSENSTIPHWVEWHWYCSVDPPRGDNLTPGDEPDLAREILSYFLHNPNAADTVEGVACWRLMEEKVRHTVELTSSALDWLVSLNFLVEMRTSGSVKIFQLNKERSIEVQCFLSDLRSPSSNA